MAVDRKTPTTLNFGPSIGGSAYADAVNEEIAALWDRVPVYLHSVAGTGNAIAAMVTPTELGYTKGKSYYFQPTANNSGPATINIDSLGLRDIKLLDGSALTGGEMLIGNTLHLLDTGTQLRIQSGAADSTIASQIPMSLYAYVLSSGNDGGNVTGLSRQKYPLNSSLLNEIPGASLNGVTNAFILPAGTYEFVSDALFMDCGRVQTYLRNLTAGADVGALARVQSTSHTSSVASHSTGAGKFTIGGTSSFELQYYSSGSRSGYGLGANVGSGVAEMFGYAQFKKVL